MRNITITTAKSATYLENVGAIIWGARVNEILIQGRSDDGYPIGLTDAMRIADSEHWNHSREPLVGTFRRLVIEAAVSFSSAACGVVAAPSIAEGTAEFYQIWSNII